MAYPLLCELLHGAPGVGGVVLACERVKVAHEHVVGLPRMAQVQGGRLHLLQPHHLAGILLRAHR